MKLENPIIVALDVDSLARCRELAGVLAGKVGAFKVGPRLCVRYGADLVRELAAHAPVFVDNKYLDIPNTMESAIRATFEAGATFATVHAWAGPEALKRLAAVEAELSAQRPFQILVVTVLTSYSADTLPPHVRAVPISTQVRELADMSVSCGLQGLVCSPEEVADLRRSHPSAFLVTPGIRLPSDDKGDQKRIMGPREARELGASALVIGRPIVDAQEPVAAVERVLADLAKKGSL
ncbi:MAG: orotidine-5'-phosphate decarboxylase [Bdellovibrionaceae bacterium]|nr:orotidine-5'-phosphate decarboxylase [Pseudobdellovibrionaceae bacterium]